MKDFYHDKHFIGIVIAGLFCTISSFYFENKLISPHQKNPTTVSSTKRTVPELINRELAKPKLSAQAYGIYYFNKTTGKLETLAEQNATSSLPIASITKMFTGIVAQAKIPPETVVPISFEAYNQYERNGGIELEKSYTAQNLIKASLIESSNDAAYALAEHYGMSAFIKEMNSVAKSLGAEKTNFVNPTGVDERNSENRSSVRDLSVITAGTLAGDKFINELYPIMRTATSTIRATDGTSEYLLKSTDQLITKKDFPLEIVGGKTGETPRAKQTLLLVTKSPDGNYLISVVLGSKDRFGDMTSLVTWAKDSYLWE